MFYSIGACAKTKESMSSSLWVGKVFAFLLVTVPPRRSRHLCESENVTWATLYDYRFFWRTIIFQCPTYSFTIPKETCRRQHTQVIKVSLLAYGPSSHTFKFTVHSTNTGKIYIPIHFTPRATKVYIWPTPSIFHSPSQLDYSTHHVCKFTINPSIR